MTGAIVSLFRGLFDGPQVSAPAASAPPASAPPASAPPASAPPEHKDLPVAVGDGVKESYDAFSSPAPGVDVPEGPVSEDLGWLSSWWPAMKAGYEMLTKGPKQADAATVGEGVTAPLKSWIAGTVEANTVPGGGAMASQAMDGLQKYADVLVPNKQGVNGMVGEGVKKTGELGLKALDTVTDGVNTVGGGAVGAVDTVVAAAQHALGVDDGTPVNLPTELEPIEERMDTEWPPPMAPVAPAAPAAPVQTVVQPPADANPLAV